ncbi:hypothetical protein Ait01nite_042220 [Actinoplanes italicus]|nr:hypothetical protein Ait01nite_042220 [Actinoplanes italicus]
MRVSTTTATVTITSDGATGTSKPGWTPVVRSTSRGRVSAQPPTTSAHSHSVGPYRRIRHNATPIAKYGAYPGMITGSVQSGSSGPADAATSHTVANPATRR